jgi:SHAQKYF class myb-like DNA-binding protein
LNQHSKPCQRIGFCPFHKKAEAEEGTQEPPSSETEVTALEEQNESDSGTTSSSLVEETRPLMKKAPFKRGWTKEEHLLFLRGLQIHGKGAWKEISLLIVTRTPTQIQSHAQKYFLRQKQEVKNKRSIHDVSLDELTELSPSETARLSSKLGQIPHLNPHLNRGPAFPFAMIPQLQDPYNMSESAL